MILHDFRAAMLTLLSTDAVFAAAVATLIGALAPVNTLNANRPMTELASGLMPAWIAEQGDAAAMSTNEGDDGFLVMGLSQQTFVVQLPIALAWQDNDRERAATARADLPVLLTQLMLRNPNPGGVDFAFLRSWQPDRGANHPNQVWRATIEAAITIMRD